MKKGDIYTTADGRKFAYRGSGATFDIRNYDEILPPFESFMKQTPDFPRDGLEAVHIVWDWLKENRPERQEWSIADYTTAWLMTKQDCIDAISSRNAETFLKECPDFYHSAYNAELLLQHIKTQIGDDRPISLENYHAAFEQLKDLSLLEISTPDGGYKEPPNRAAQPLEVPPSEETVAPAKPKQLNLQKIPLKVLKQLATRERRGNIEPSRLRTMDRTGGAAVII